MNERLRRLPKVDALLNREDVQALIDQYPRRVVLAAIRDTLDDLRQRLLSGQNVPPPDIEPTAVAAQVKNRTIAAARPVFRRVVNGAGVIIHTNLGRSCMAEEALEAIHLAGRYYGNLEFDLATGRRGSRYSHVEALLKDLTGAEAALVVNNNAAAVLIALQTMAMGREVLVSRGELVEIGGSFRVPDVMAQSGARLVEVGATNKTHLADYQRAVTPQTRLALKVHQSNFQMVGFTEAVPAAELAAWARSQNLLSMEDLGSGCLVDLGARGVRKEPTVQETVAAGLDVVTFSGDKLLGGPQAGVILGQAEIVAEIKKNPLNRALRIDKFTLAGLEATLRLYLDESKAMERIPTLRRITMPYEQVRRMAVRLARLLVRSAGPGVTIETRDGFSEIGGGALPTQLLKTRLVTLAPEAMSVNQLEERFRSRDVPVIGRIENDRFVLDPRTLETDDFRLLAEAVADLFPAKEA